MAEEADKKPSSTQKIVDISEPATAPAIQSISVSHGPVISGPTTTKEEETENKTDEAPGQTMAHELKIEPPKEAMTPDQADNQKAELDKATPEPEKADPSQADEPPKTQASEQKPNQEETEASSKDQGEDKPETSESKEDKQKQAEAEAAAKAEHDAHINDLATSEKYFLAINRQEKRRNRHAVLLGAIVCILLAAAWLDIALDAGLISNSMHLPHTHYFALKP